MPCQKVGTASAPPIGLYIPATVTVCCTAKRVLQTIRAVELHDARNGEMRSMLMGKGCVLMPENTQICHVRRWVPFYAASPHNVSLASEAASFRAGSPLQHFCNALHEPVACHARCICYTTGRDYTICHGAHCAQGFTPHGILVNIVEGHVSMSKGMS